MQIITEISEYLKIKYSAPGDACKCGNCQLVPPEVIWRTIGEIDGLRDALKRAQREAGRAAVNDGVREPRTAAGSLD